MVRYTWRASVAVPDRLEMERPESAETEEVSLFPEAQPQHPQRQQRFRLLQQHMIKVPPIRFVGDCCPPTAQYTRGWGGGCEKKKKRDNRSCLAFGSGRRIRTLTYRVRVCCATLTQSRYTRAALISADAIIAKRWKMSRGKMKKSKKLWAGQGPAHRERVNGGWEYRSYPGAAPAFFAEDACSPGERDSGFWTSSGRCTGSA